MNKLYVVGLGPGSEQELTPRAMQALKNSEVIFGYTVYVDLLRPILPGKTYISTPMTQEIKRCQMALEKAQAGMSVSMVCSGDAGVYGMAGLLYELLSQYPDVQMEVVPGVTAALSGAACLGAPLTNDFAVISLSDLLTPMQTIQKRLHSAAMGDFVICLYNPSSRRRKGYLRMACDIVLQYRPGQTVCGYVQNIGREGQSSRVLPLEDLREEEVDMFTTVFIGNSQTRQLGDFMVTPRGYKHGV